MRQAADNFKVTNDEHDVNDRDSTEAMELGDENIQRDATARVQLHNFLWSQFQCYCIIISQCWLNYPRAR